MEKTVLIVEDEQAIVEILKYNLQKEGYETLEAFDGETGLQLAREQDPDLMLLDLMLPKMSGFDVCSTLRSEGSTIPILMLTAREEEADKVLGLESGADDYIVKPFSMRELMARVGANIRRRTMDTAAPTGMLLQRGPLELNLSSCTLRKNGAAVDLTQKEFDLLHFFMAAPGRVFSREELMKQVWNYEFFGDMRTVDVTVRRLREKIEDDPGAPLYILTRRGLGYLFTAD